MRKIELSPFQQKQLEDTLLRSIRECNAGMKLCNAEGNKRGYDYIKEVKRKPLIKKLFDVRKGYIFE